jgi:hypothetical protein
MSGELQEKKPKIEHITIIVKDQVHTMPLLHTLLRLKGSLSTLSLSSFAPIWSLYRLVTNRSLTLASFSVLSQRLRSHM